MLMYHTVVLVILCLAHLTRAQLNIETSSSETDSHWTSSSISELKSKLAWETSEEGFYWHYPPENQPTLVDFLRYNHTIKSDLVAKAMYFVDRFHYSKTDPFADTEQDIGYGANISAPSRHAFLLNTLRRYLLNGTRALDVGSGCGYFTVLMATFIGPHGFAVGVEHIPQLVNMSKVVAEVDNPVLYRAGRAIFVEGDGRLGHPERGPYDVIHIGASVTEVPQALFDQLKLGGRMLVPVGPPDQEQIMVVFDKHVNGSILRYNMEKRVQEPPLTDKKTQLKKYLYKAYSVE